MLKFGRILSATVLMTLPLFAQQKPIVPQKTVAQGDRQFNEKRDSPEVDDMEALRRWIRDKRFVTVKEIGGDLSISGEVRTEFQDINEKRDGVRQRGEGSPFTDPKSKKAQYVWDVEFNLMIDYRTDRTWAAVKLEFDNDMGQRSGTMDKIALEKAYLGGRIVAADTLTIDAEIGRRYLINVFDSKVEFGSLFDGCLFRFNKTWPSIGDFYANVGALLVDDKVNHYAYVTEIGGLRIGNVGLNLKYSIIDWYKPYANPINNLRYKYLVSQFQAVYQFYPDWIGNRFIKFYAAGLTNHLAHGVSQTRVVDEDHPKGHILRQNWGWYAGMSIGLVKKKGDWALDANYQWIQAQTIPDFDTSGIGRGNAAGVGFYSNKLNGDPESGKTTNETAVGGCNYQGFQLEALYAFTDNITVQQIFKYSITLNTDIGPNLRYKQYELEFIYAF